MGKIWRRIYPSTFSHGELQAQIKQSEDKIRIIVI